MKVYVLISVEVTYGEDYEDRIVGVYTSREKMEDARYKESQVPRVHYLHSNRAQHFVENSFELDK